MNCTRPGQTLVHPVRNYSRFGREISTYKTQQTLSWIEELDHTARYPRTQVQLRLLLPFPVSFPVPACSRFFQFLRSLTFSYVLISSYEFGLTHILSWNFFIKPGYRIRSTLKPKIFLYRTHFWLPVGLFAKKPQFLAVLLTCRF